MIKIIQTFSPHEVEQDIQNWLYNNDHKYKIISIRTPIRCHSHNDYDEFYLTGIIYEEEE